MRKEIEKLKEGTAVERLLYVLFALGGRVLPSARREEIVRWVKRITRYRPPYARRVKGLGVTTEKRSPQVIVSLTSYPARIGTVHRVITALLNQTFKPDKVILWLGEDKFPRREAELPRKLLRLREHGLTIGWCKDLRSYTKLIPSLKAFPDDIIVTVDDDVFQRPECLERLYESYVEQPDAVHCHIVNEIGIVDGKIQPYNDWKWCRQPGKSSFRHLLMGVGGVLYPPHSLAGDVCNVSLFQRVAPTNDDMWFWAMAVLNNSKIRLIPRAFCTMMTDCSANNKTALLNQNIGAECRSDADLMAILEAYPSLEARLNDVKSTDEMY